MKALIIRKKPGIVCFYLFTAILVLYQGCTKEKETIYLNIKPWVNYGTISDLDGNVYKTIAIGSQTWMVANLTTTKLNDGTPIPLVTDAKLWSGLESAACCWHDNNPAYHVTYGVLYNWYAVGTNKLCPAGWHVPTDEEWTLLTNYAGGEYVAGARLKEAGLIHWNSPNTGATNQTYFRALPGGILNSSDSLFQYLHKTGCWWTSTAIKNLAFSRLMFDSSVSVEKVLTARTDGLSVRCIKDE